MNAHHRQRVPLILLAATSLIARAEDVQRMEAVEATAREEALLSSGARLEPAREAAPPQPDTSALLADTPGASIVRNGDLTGIVQLRGLFNERVRVDIDGMQITPACPNHMDPPLHYSAPSEIDTLVILPGITPVSDGGDSIAGTVKARSVDPAFFVDGPGIRGEAGGGYSGENEGRLASARVEAGNAYYVLSTDASWARANDTDFADGRIADTGYKTDRGAVRLDAKTGTGRTTLELGAARSNDVGTPALPMDMVKDNANRARLNYDGAPGMYEVEASAYWHDINHTMDNYSLRPVTGMRMQAPSDSRDAGFRTALARPAGGGTLHAGIEGYSNALDAYQRNVATSATQDIYRGATRERAGLFAEWEHQPGRSWQAQYGLRTDYVQSDTENINNSFPPASADQAAFNSRGHFKNQLHLDATALWRYNASPALGYIAAVARKTRSPSLLEYYLWTPLSASAGQADGRTYLGNLDLDPEVSHQISLGLDYHPADFSLKPSVFYNRVSDYIQGSPIARLDANGNPVLKYQNFDADLYGFDGSWNWQTTSRVALGGTLSYVRGKNRTTDDNLYRIAPLNGVLYSDLQTGRWTHRAEVRAAAQQHKVSSYNDEQKSGGWAILNLRTQWSDSRWQLHGGVENLFDKNYHDHLAGINRVNDGDVGVGDPIPAAGRFGYVQARYYW
jgi:iron complex outermembrane receptor protein